jgi:hypothetical protein
MLTGLLAAQSIISDSPEHALISSENHGILAPGSSREFRYPRKPKHRPNARPIITQASPAWPSRGRPWHAGQSIPCIEDELPRALYSLTKTTNGWTLRIREQPLLSSIVVLGPTIITAEGRMTWALRSLGPIGNTNKPHILWRGNLLGPEKGLHFLATSQAVTVPGMGRVFTIEIPRQTIYGYWESGLHALPIVQGSFIRVRLYGLAWGYQGAQAKTYRIPIR